MLDRVKLKHDDIKALQLGTVAQIGWTLIKTSPRTPTCHSNELIIKVRLIKRGIHHTYAVQKDYASPGGYWHCHENVITPPNKTTSPEVIQNANFHCSEVTRIMLFKSHESWLTCRKFSLNDNSHLKQYFMYYHKCCPRPLHVHYTPLYGMGDWSCTSSKWQWNVIVHRPNSGTAIVAHATNITQHFWSHIKWNGVNPPCFRNQ